MKLKIFKKQEVCHVVMEDSLYFKKIISFIKLKLDTLTLCLNLQQVKLGI